ncbi:MAG: hypothetical protein GTO00_09170 [Deltaproteobacteria bacterium]|nr:hypothetical protein [Deltaproteobacteria bacterium]
MLQKEFPLYFVSGPWFNFINDERMERQWCQPDGLLVDILQGLVTIVEVKLRHTSDAWWQTRHLYEPVMRRFFDERLWKFNVLEIVRWYDPDVRFPERYKMVGGVDELEPGKFGVHIWKP